MQPLIAHPGSYRAAFFAALTVLALPQIYGMVRLRPDRDASVHDRGSYRVLHGCVGAGVLLAYGTATQMDGAAITWGRHALFDAGLALMFGGAIAGLYTISLLGRSFTVQVAVRPGQQIVEAGPYRWVRHPSYAAQLVSLLGFALLLTNWASVAVLMTCAATGYGYRIVVEEQALLAEFGEQYRSYMRRSRRLIPYVL